MSFFTFIRRVLGRIKRFCLHTGNMLFWSLYPFFLYKKGVRERKTEENIIVSFTSFPERVNMRGLLPRVVCSMLRQTFKPDRIVLWLAEEEFSNQFEDLPASLLTLRKNGLEIRFCKNTGSYKKLLPAIEEFPESLIVTADDDVEYPKIWLEQMITSYREHPECVIAHRCCRLKINDGELAPYSQWGSEVISGVSRKNIFTGVGGVLYPPNILDISVLDYSIIKKIAPAADDLIFWTAVILKGNSVYAIPDGLTDVKDLIPDKKNYSHLCNENLSGGNDRAMNMILSYYPRLLEIIKSLDSEE